MLYRWCDNAGKESAFWDESARELYLEINMIQNKGQTKIRLHNEVRDTSVYIVILISQHKTGVSNIPVTQIGAQTPCELWQLSYTLPHPIYEYILEVEY